MTDLWTKVCDASTRSDEWLRARSEMITASDVPVIMGRSSYKDPYELWCEKVGAIEPDAAGELAEMGHRSESMNLQWYKDKTGRNAESAQFLAVSTRYPWLGATCDAWVQARLPEGIKVLPLELKWANSMKVDDWNDGLPDYYVPQVVSQALVMGTEQYSHIASSSVICGGFHRWCDLEPYPELAEEIIDVTRDFMRRVKEKDPPPVSDRSAGALAKQFPEDQGEVVTLDGSFVDATLNIEAWEKEIKKTKKLIDEEKNRIRMAMADATTAVIPGHGSWSWKTQTRKIYAKTELLEERTSRVLRRGK